MAPQRTAAGCRVYGEDAVERLAFIDTAKHLGLALEEIKDLLAVWEFEACSSIRERLRR
jgi:MerR family copper efflux transcriptional regulator